MVARTSIKDASTRAQTQASRATVREINTKPYWSEGKKIDVFPGETASDVEWAQSYGNVSVPAKQDEEEEDQKEKGGQQSSSGGGGGAGGKAGDAGPEGKQPKGDAAEGIIMYLNGSRSHPVMIAVGDRRHQLLELEEGDVAQHRLKDDRQQMLYSKDGTYISTRSDKIFRVALVPKKDDQQEQSSQQQQADAGGAGTSGSGGGKQKKKKTYGQKSAKDDNKSSQVAIEQNGSVTTSQHGNIYSAERGGSDQSSYVSDRKKSTQVTDTHSHLRTDDFRIFTDVEGCWTEVPILVKKDKHCKE